MKFKKDENEQTRASKQLPSGDTITEGVLFN